MARLIAYFTTSGNNLSYYPQAPFQILYVNRPTGTNTFSVFPGTMFFLPVAYSDDSPPILGDFPTSASAVGNYFFSRAQLGGHDLAIIVDGKVTPIGPAYAAGPVLTPGLLDGGGSHFTQLGALLTPLPPGTHTVTIRGTFDGAAWAPYGGGFSFEITYTVIVRWRRLTGVGGR
jgi:hypothetical protein